MHQVFLIMHQVGEPGLDQMPLVGEPLKNGSPWAEAAQSRVFSHTPSSGRGRRCLPEGKRHPPPATPSFKVEKT